MKTPVVVPGRMSDPTGKESWEQTGCEGNKSLVLGLAGTTALQGYAPSAMGLKGSACPQRRQPPTLPLSPNVL